MTQSITPIVILTGATGSGKSALALSIAEKRGGVIINADSQQIYRELRILTARPSPEEEARVPHRLYGTLPAHVPCSAGKWLEYAKMEIDWALSQNKTPIVVGGTGLYIKALLEGIADIPDIDPAVRAQAASDYEAMGKDAFAARLAAVDPLFFERLKVQDRQRLVRAYEVWLGTGKPLSWWQSQGGRPAYPRDSFLLFQTELPREDLYRRCDARFDRMLKQGAVEEVKQLLDLHLSPDLPLMKSVGVKEISAYLAGNISLEEAAQAVRQATRHYAKRQLTWFRNQLPEAIHALKPAEILNFIDQTRAKH